MSWSRPPARLRAVVAPVSQGETVACHKPVWAAYFARAERTVDAGRRRPHPSRGRPSRSTTASPEVPALEPVRKQSSAVALTDRGHAAADPAGGGIVGDIAGRDFGPHRGRRHRRG